MKFSALLFSASVAAAAASNIETDPDFPKFQNFVTKYRRQYANQAEVQGRFAIFKDNLKLIEQRNNDGGLDTHGITKFADLHPHEFKAMFLGTTPTDLKDMQVKTFNETQLSVGASPKNIDWRTLGAVTPIKNQGQCGSCWAFSATEQIESATFLDTKVLPILSPQQIVSCDTVDAGCNGGNPINAYAYASQAGGLEYAHDYLYSSGTTQSDGTCAFKSSDIAPNTKPVSYSLVSQSATQESNMIAQIQESPMSVCVDAELWQTYVSGTITESDGCGTSIDHAVQAIGVGGVGSGTPYWIVRNSWGADYGVNGCVFVAIGSNVCGITAEATTVNL